MTLLPILPTHALLFRFGSVPIPPPPPGQVPFAVIVSQDAVQPVAMDTGKGQFNVRNAVHVGGGLYLTVRHLLLNGSQTPSIRVGGRMQSRGISGKPATLVATSNPDDLVLVKVEGFPGVEDVLRPPIRMSNQPPQHGDQLYLIGKHRDTEGKRVIPLFLSEPPNWLEGVWNRMRRLLTGQNPLTYFETTDSQRYQEVDPRSLSGSAIVNEDGELETVAVQAKVDNQGKLLGTVMSPKPERVRAFLKQHTGKTP